MKYDKIITLKNGTTAHLHNGDSADGAEVFEVFNRTHGETDYLLSYPDENSYDPEQEAKFLEKMTNSDKDVEIVAVIDGKIVGTAGIEQVGAKYKVAHRAEFGISVLREYWGLGLGRALTEACIQCAKDAGYDQLELNAVAENDRALTMYKKAGFVEFGRNPIGFRSRFSGYQEVVYMRLDLRAREEK